MGRPRRSDHTTSVLRQEIEQGRFRDAPLLPGERQLAAMLDVSRTTLRKALADLTSEGLLSQRHGRGTFINGTSAAQIKTPVNRPLVCFDLNGRIDRIVELSRGVATASMDDAMAFGIAPSDNVFRIARVLYVGGKPDAVEYACAPLRFLPDPSLVTDFLPAALAAQGHRPVKKLQRLRLGALSEEDAAHLGMRPEAGAICVHEAFFAAGGVCCALNRAFYPAARFDAVFSAPLASSDPATISTDA